MPPESMSVRWILHQLDRSAEDFSFPDLGHPYVYAIDARLHGYADSGRWALVVEIVGYNPRASSVEDALYTFGNCLTSGEPGYANEDFLDRVENFQEVVDEDETWTGRDVTLRGRPVHVEGAPGEDLPAVFRRLVPAHRELLLADEAELRRRIPSDLQEFLTLDEWHQPKLFDTKPSQSQAYQLLAQSLSAGDPARYQPTEVPNTHWSHWPESGSL